MADTYLRDDVAGFFTPDPIASAWAMDGVVVRAVAGRETLRVTLGERVFYLKRHKSVGIVEVLKNWLVLKRPILGARNEYVACRHLERMGITAPTVAAFAEADGLPGRRWSFVLCDALLGYEDLEALTQSSPGQDPTSRGSLTTGMDDPFERRRLIMQVAEFARRFHEAGLVHRDFYLCHLLRNQADPKQPLAVLDLHRALIFRALPDRWRERDLAALLFSSLDVLPDRRAWLRFVRVYSGKPLREVFEERGRFWRKVHERALALYRKGSRKGLTQGRFEQ